MEPYQIWNLFRHFNARCLALAPIHSYTPDEIIVAYERACEFRLAAYRAWDAIYVRVNLTPRTLPSSFDSL